MKTGMSSHQRTEGATNEWLTPPHILAALGTFDLDPCAPLVRPWSTAKLHYAAPEQDGLALPWEGRVWLNPPYGRDTEKWMQRLATHGRGTALIFARTETNIFFPWVWECASAVLFLHGRLHFHHVDGTRAKANAGAPSVLVAYGEDDAEQLALCGLPGKFLNWKVRR